MVWASIVVVFATVGAGVVWLATDKSSASQQPTSDGSHIANTPPPDWHDPQWQRDSASIPSVSSRRLQNILDDLYNASGKTDRYGDGTTFDAVRYELATGRAIKNKPHLIKADDYMRALENWLIRSPGAPADDVYEAEVALQRLIQALSGQ
jgi:hypothetical protein